MGKLILFKLEKLVQRKLIWAIIGVLLLLNGVLVLRQLGQSDSGYTYGDVTAVYQELSVLSQEEQLSQLEERVDDLTTLVMEQNLSLEEYPYPAYKETVGQELGLISYVYGQVSLTLGYEEYLDYVQEQATQLTQSTLFAQPNGFSYRNALRTAAVYARLQGTSVTVAPSDGVKLVTDWRITDVLLLLAVAVLLLQFLISEREDGTISMIKPTKQGHGATIGAKWMIVTLMVILLTASFYGINFVLGWSMVGLGDLGRSIQSLDGYLESPFSLTVGGYLLCFFAGKVVAVFVITMVLFFLCIVLRNSVYTVLIGAGILGAEFLLWKEIEVHSWLSLLSQCNLMAFLDTGSFFAEYFNVNLLGWPVNRCLIGGAGAILVGSLCTLLAVRRFCREGTVEPQKLPRLSLGNQSWKIHTSLIRHEGYKLLWTNGGLILLVLLIVLQVESYGTQTYYITEQEYYYNQYSEDLSGPITEETWAYLAAEEERFLEADQQRSALQDALFAGTISDQAYSRAVSGVEIRDAQKSAFQQVWDQVEALSQQEGDDIAYLPQSGWNALLGERGQQQDAIDAGKILFVLILAFSGVFSLEYSSGMTILIRVSRKGSRAVARRKVMLCGIYSILMALIGFLPRFMSLAIHYNFNPLGTNVHSVLLLGGVQTEMPLLWWLICFFICRCIGVMLSGWLILFLSQTLKNTLGAMIASAVLLLVPICLFWMGLCDELGLVSLVTGKIML